MIEVFTSGKMYLQTITDDPFLCKRYIQSVVWTLRSGSDPDTAITSEQ